MNGFANAILTIMLGWLRSLLAAAWTLLGSESGGAFMTFLRGNWKLLFLILCVGGFVVDRVIYLLRWRPYYVWQARRQRRRQRWAQPSEDERYAPYAPPEAEPYPREDAPGFAAGGTTRYTRPTPAQRYVPEYEQGGAMPAPAARGGYGVPRHSPDGAQAYTRAGQRWNAPGAYAPQAGSAPGAYAQQAENMPGAYAQQSAYPEAYPPARGAQGVRAPLAQAPFSPQASFAPTASYAAVRYQPLVAEPLAAEPRYDDDLAAWAVPRSAYDDFAPALAPGSNPAQGLRPSFGAPQPEPPGSLQAVQPRYAPAAQPQPAAAPRLEAAADPVHPGLDLQTIQQNIGLGGAGAADAAPGREEASYARFAPFPHAAQAEPTAKPRGLGALARRARNLVGGDDERDRPTIRDLQPTVDVKSAFREPVYPKKPTESENE